MASVNITVPIEVTHEALKKFGVFKAREHAGHKTLEEIADELNQYQNELTDAYAQLRGFITNEEMNDPKLNCVGIGIRRLKKEFEDRSADLTDRLHQRDETWRALALDHGAILHRCELLQKQNEELISKFDPATRRRRDQTQARVNDNLLKPKESTIPGARNDWAPERREVAIDEQYGEEFERR